MKDDHSAPVKSLFQCVIVCKHNEKITFSQRNCFSGKLTVKNINNCPSQDACGHNGKIISGRQNRVGQERTPTDIGDVLRMAPGPQGERCS